MACVVSTPNQICSFAIGSIVFIIADFPITHRIIIEFIEIIQTDKRIFTQHLTEFENYVKVKNRNDKNNCYAAGNRTACETNEHPDFLKIAGGESTNNANLMGSKKRKNAHAKYRCDIICV